MLNQSNHQGLSLPPVLQEQVNQVRVISYLVPFLRLLSWFGIGGDRLKTFVHEIKDLKRKMDELLELPVAFHDAFSEYGWLLSESTNADTAQKALNILKDGDLSEAENLLAADFDGERLDWKIIQMCQLDEFRTRIDQLREAAALTREGRYLASIPLLLIIADGVGSDAFGKSIFAEGVYLEELNSFAGQPEALPKLIRKMCGTRRRTNSDHLSFPYRNGILHGRDLGYGNRLVNAKCWSLLGNIVDIIRTRKAGQTLESEPKPSLRDSLTIYAQTLELKQRIKEWVPRPVVDKRIEVTEEVRASMDKDEPEAAFVEFLQAWKASNYGRMAQMTDYHKQLPINRRAGEIRKLMQNRGLTLIDAVITRIEDLAPSVTEINCNLTLCADDQEFINHFVFRMICHGKAGEGAVRGDEGAQWWIRPEYLYQYWTEQGV